MKQEIKAIRKLYEKQFLQLNKSDSIDAALKRAEAAEKERDELHIHNSTLVEDIQAAHERLSMAEARVKELESEVLGISNDFYVYMNLYGSNVNPIKAEELGDRLRALAGEKTK